MRTLPLVTMCLVGCAQTPLTGTVFKGPAFGGTVAAYPVDRNYDFIPYDEIWFSGRYETVRPRHSRFVRIHASARFYDEVTEDLSTTETGLDAYLEPEGPEPVAHINLLTHFVSMRVGLLREEMRVDDALDRAEPELVQALGIGPDGFELSARATEIDPYGGDTTDAAYMVAVSAIVASTGADESIGPWSVDDIMFAVGVEFSENGTVSEDTLAMLAVGESSLDTALVRQHLELRYASIGIDAPVPQFEAFIDGDEDGFFADVDCDDHAPTRYPGAPEVCDPGVADDDCDGLADDSDPSLDPATRAVLYQDLDGDGHGTDVATSLGCHPTEGWAAVDGDCNDDQPRAWASCGTCADGDADGFWAGCDAYLDGAGSDCEDADDGIFPGAPERCNGLDDDCNAGLPDVEIDHDDDGYVECDLAVPPESWGNPETVIVIGGGDCDDNAATVRPGAPEVCDGVLSDCDDRTSGAVPPLDETDDDPGGGDGFVECEPAGVWLGPSGLAGRDCDDGDATVHPGALEQIGDGDRDCNGSDLAAFEGSGVIVGTRDRSASTLTSSAAGDRIGIATAEGSCAQIAWLDTAGALAVDDVEQRCRTFVETVDIEAAPEPASPVAEPPAAGLAWSWAPAQSDVTPTSELSLCRYAAASDAITCAQEFPAVTADDPGEGFLAVDVVARPDGDWWRIACGATQAVLATSGFGSNASTVVPSNDAATCFLLPGSDDFEFALCDTDACSTWSWDLTAGGEAALASSQPVAGGFAETVTYGPLLVGHAAGGTGLVLQDFDADAVWDLLETERVYSAAARVHDGVYYVFAHTADVATFEDTWVLVYGDAFDTLTTEIAATDESGLGDADLVVTDDGVLLISTVVNAQSNVELVWSWNAFP